MIFQLAYFSINCILIFYNFKILQFGFSVSKHTPLKASHSEMTSADMILALEKCFQLLTRGLIEPTTSD